MNISIFIDLDPEYESYIFSTINQAQTKVNKSLVYDLYSLLSKTPYNLIKELHTLKSDARQAKHAYQRQIFQTGELPSIKDIKITRVDTTTKNYIETLLLGAGLKSWY